jgi:hypothetical protein
MALVNDVLVEELRHVFPPSYFLHKFFAVEASGVKRRFWFDWVNGGVEGSGGVVVQDERVATNALNEGLALLVLSNEFVSPILRLEVLKFVQEFQVIVFYLLLSLAVDLFVKGSAVDDQIGAWLVVPFLPLKRFVTFLLAFDCLLTEHPGVD